MGINDGNWSIPLQAAIEKMQSRDLSGALELLLEAVDKEPDNVRLINLMAACYYYLGEFDRAEACWLEVLKTDPHNSASKNHLSRFKTPTFQSWLKKYRRAMHCLEQKNYRMALSALREVMEENDGFVSVYQCLGLCYMASSDPEQARIVWKRGLMLDCSNEALLRYLNSPSSSSLETTAEAVPQIYLSGKEDKTGKVRWLILKRPEPRTIAAVAGVLCMALILQGGLMIHNSHSSKEAMTEMQNRLSQMSHQLEETGSSGTDRTETPVMSEEMNFGDSDSAEGSNYDLEREKDYYRIGYQAYKDADLDKAVQNLSTVVAINSGDYINREALYYLARTYYLKTDFTEAERYYLKYIDEFPGTNYHDDSLFYLAVIYYNDGETSKALQSLQEMKRVSPDSGYESSEFYQKIMAASI